MNPVDLPREEVEMDGQDWELVEFPHLPGVKVHVRWGAGADAKSGMISGLCITGEAVTARQLRSIPLGRLEILRRSGGRPKANPAEDLPLPLRRSDYKDPDQFASQVARCYLEFARMSSKPAVEIAERSGVPVSTVRGWVREARLRGKLLPGTPGKAG